MGVAAAIFPSMSVRASDRQQQSRVDATLRMVERALSAHKTLRTEIRQGRARVDAMVSEALGQTELDHEPDAVNSESGNEG